MPENVTVRRTEDNQIHLRIQAGAATSEVAAYLVGPNGALGEVGRKPAHPFELVEFDIQGGPAPTHDEFFRARAFGPEGEPSDVSPNLAIVENTKPEPPVFVE